MKAATSAALDIVSALTFLGAIGCEFLTFATNDYRSIHATGFALFVLALSCFAAARGWRMGWIGIPLMALALALIRLMSVSE